MKRYQLFVIGLITSAIAGFATAGSIEEKWGVPLVGPFGLKEYVVSILSAKNQPNFEQQKLEVAKPTADLLSKIDVVPFLYAYDSLGSERDIEDLAKLSPYYLGEAAGTLYQCLVLRKGQKILPDLQKLAKRKSNECIERFGQEANICLTDNEYRAHIKKYIGTISSLTKTNETTSLCTTSGWSSM